MKKPPGLFSHASVHLGQPFLHYTVAHGESKWLEFDPTQFQQLTVPDVAHFWQSVRSFWHRTRCSGDVYRSDAVQTWLRQTLVVGGSGRSLEEDEETKRRENGGSSGAGPSTSASSAGESNEARPPGVAEIDVEIPRFNRTYPPEVCHVLTGNLSYGSWGGLDCFPPIDWVEADWVDTCSRNSLSLFLFVSHHYVVKKCGGRMSCGVQSCVSSAGVGLL